MASFWKSSANRPLIIALGITIFATLIYSLALRPLSAHAYSGVDLSPFTTTIIDQGGGDYRVSFDSSFFNTSAGSSCMDIFEPLNTTGQVLAGNTYQPDNTRITAYSGSQSPVTNNSVCTNGVVFSTNNTGGSPGFLFGNPGFTGGQTGDFYVEYGYAGSPSEISTATPMAFLVVHWDGTTPTIPNGGMFTRITATVPNGGSTIATSSAATVGATVFIKAEDFKAGEFIRLSIRRNQDNQSSVSNPDLITKTINFSDVTHDQYTIVSTTTPLTREGVYTMQADLRSTSFVASVLGFFGLNGLADPGLIVSTTTTFIVGAPTSYDNFIASTTGAISDFLASTTLDIGVCDNWTKFSLINCLSLIFTWQDAPMQKELGHIHDTVSSFAPWGYGTRFMEIIANPATTSIPAFSYTFPANFPGAIFAGQTFSFDPWQYFDSYKGFVANDGSGKNVWEIIDPFFTAFVWLLVAFMIFNDLVKVHDGDSNQGGGRASRGRTGVTNNIR